MIENFPNNLTRYDIKTIRRIEFKTRYTDTGNHWMFNGKWTGKGYGNIWYKGRTIRINRLICHLFHGMELDDLTKTANHKDNCIHHNCWNPDHLYTGTQYDNVRDQIRTDRFHYGTENLLGYKRARGLV